MDDDLNTSRALATVHDMVREGNAALRPDDDDAIRGALGRVLAMLDVLGLDPLDPHWSGGAGRRSTLDRRRAGGTGSASSARPRGTAKTGPPPTPSVIN